MHAGHPVLQKRLAQRLLCRERGGGVFHARAESSVGIEGGAPSKTRGEKECSTVVVQMFDVCHRRGRL